MNRSIRSSSIALPAIAVVTLFLVTLSPSPLAAANVSLNSVLLEVQTTGSAPINSYDIMAYNSSGSLVANYQGQFAQVAFQLPAGKYLFAVDASGPSPGEPCGTGVVSPGPVVVGPCLAYNPVEEYGYSLTTVSAATTISITTQQAASLPTTGATVTVDYKNGTAVSGAQVSASVVGAGYYWGGDQKLQMYAQTGNDGVAHLVVPVAPLVVTGSKSVPITLPKTQTTVQVNIGGQLVNVTVYYGPSSVYLRGTSLIVPPQTSASITLTAQPGYPIIPLATAAAGNVALPPTSTASQSAAGNSTQSIQTTAIPPLPVDAIAAPSQTSPAVAQTGYSPGLLQVAGALGVIALAVAIGLAVFRPRR